MRIKLVAHRQDGALLGEFFLGNGVHIIGRDPEAAVCLESDYISRRHASLHISDQGMELDDLGSTCGVILDGNEITNRTAINPGQMVQLGDLTIQLTMAETGQPSPGIRIGAGRYTLAQELGRGAMGTVWLATDNDLNEQIAIKMLAPELAGDVLTINDLKREVQKNRSLSHEHILRVFDLSNLPGEAPFLTLEYIDGASLDVILANRPLRSLQWDQAKLLVLQLCQALDYAHRQRVVHRDIKPANIMVTQDWATKLTDFGISATVADAASRSSLGGQVSGTPAYMSPQQIQGKSPQPSDDIYSLGATLYEILTGYPPFYTGDVRHQVLNQTPPPLAEVLRERGHDTIPPDFVNTLINACLAKNSDQRPSGMDVICEWINTQGNTSQLTKQKKTETVKSIASDSISENLESASHTPVHKLHTRKIKSIYAMAVLIVIAIGLGIFIWLNQSDETDPDEIDNSINQSVTKPQPTDQSLWSGLTVHITFDDEQIDSSKYGNHPEGEKLISAPDKQGVPTGAAKFDGKSSNLVIKSSDTLKELRLVTFSAWIWIDPQGSERKERDFVGGIIDRIPSPGFAFFRIINDHLDFATNTPHTTKPLAKLN